MSEICTQASPPIQLESRSPFPEVALRLAGKGGCQWLTVSLCEHGNTGCLSNLEERQQQACCEDGLEQEAREMRPPIPCKLRFSMLSTLSPGLTLIHRGRKMSESI